MENRPRGTPPSAVKRKRGSGPKALLRLTADGGVPLGRFSIFRRIKYSNVGHGEGYISETVQHTASGTING